MKRISACTLDCPDTCSFVVEESLKGLSIRGNPEHPFTRGFICSKGASLPKRLSHPDRITRPLVLHRGEHHPISWDEALDMCAEKINALSRTPERMLHVRGYGYRGVLADASKLVFGTLGTATTHGSLCDSTGITALETDFGALRQNDALQLAEAQTVVNWGKDLSRSSVHTAVLIRTAKKNGAHVVSISPGGDGNQDYSDRVISIRPGTDRYLALAILRLLHDSGRLFADWRRYVANADAVLQLMTRHTVSELLHACDVSEADATHLAGLYASDKAVASLLGWGLQRHRLGGQNIRAINALCTLSGQIGSRAAGVYYNLASSRGFSRSSKPSCGPRRSFLLTDLAAQLEHADPPVDFCWVDGSNVVNQVPDAGRMARVFSEIPFTVAVDAFFTDTVCRANLILPCALTMEREEIVGSCLHGWVNYSSKQVDPPGKVRNDYDILTDLCTRLDTPVRLPDSREWLSQSLSGLGVSLEELRQKGFARINEPEVAWQGMRFDHEDCRAHLLEELDHEPPADDDWPLHLLSLIRRTYVHSQIPAERMQELPVVFVSPDCAHLPDLDVPVYLATALGRLPVQLEMDSTLRADTVIMRRGGWMSHGWNPNVLIAPQSTDMGDGAALYSQQCRLEN